MWERFVVIGVERTRKLDESGRGLGGREDRAYRQTCMGKAMAPIVAPE